MREIKFRAWIRCGEWDEQGEKQAFQMIQSDELAFEEYEPLCDQLVDREDEAYYMQYTGLKDKNGTEIYEGDILQTICRDGKKLSKFEIYWCTGTVRFRKKRQDGETFDMDIVSETMKEIIGNIYENPELLEDNHEQKNNETVL